MVINRTAIAITAAVCFAAGCATGPEQPDSEEMYIKASALTKLSAAVESTVRYKNPPSDLNENELLNLATRHDPVLLENFKGYKVRSCVRIGIQWFSYAMQPVHRRYWKMLAAPARWIVTAGRRSQSRASFRLTLKRHVMRIKSNFNYPFYSHSCHAATRNQTIRFDFYQIPCVPYVAFLELFPDEVEPLVILITVTTE